MSEKVIFNESEHSYTTENSKKRYISVTTLISKFKQPFDKKKVSEAYAKKNGGTAEYWQKKWDKISKDACEKGTKFHAKKEAEILKDNGKLPIEHSHDSFSITEKRVSYVDFDNISNGIYTELVVYNHYFELAGQVDFTDIDNEFFDLDDHKTNKKIDKFSYFNPSNHKYKMMLGPLSHLMDCNYTHYVLQLSAYAFMIEQLTGKKVRNLQFTHYPPDIFEDDGISKEGVVYKVPYLKKEVLLMLENYTKKDSSQFK